MHVVILSWAIHALHNALIISMLVPYATIHTSEHDITCRHENLVRQFSVNFEHVLKAFYSNSSCYYTVQYNTFKDIFVSTFSTCCLGRTPRRWPLCGRRCSTWPAGWDSWTSSPQLTGTDGGAHPFTRAGHAGQHCCRDNVTIFFRPQSCWLWQYYYISYGYSI